MIYPDYLKLRFIIASFIFCVILIFFVINMFKKKNEYRKYIAIAILIGIASIIAYCLFLLHGAPGAHFQAVFFDSLYFVGTDWMALSMLIFAMRYTELLADHRKTVHISFSVICGLDTLSLFLNNWTHHMFDLVYTRSVLGIYYWGNVFYLAHYLHLSICYVMVGATFILFGIATIQSPSFHKEKYLGILIAYFILIILNMVCYSLDLPIDISILFYVVLAGFICHFSTYTYPHKLVNKSLEDANNNISDGLLYFNGDGECIYANKMAKKIFVSEKIIKKGSRKFNNELYFDGKKAEEFKNKIAEKIEDGTDQGNMQIKLMQGKSLEIKPIIQSFEVEGEIRYFEVEYKKEFYQDFEIGCYINLIDKTTAVTAFEKEKYAVTHDELTGVYNRVGFFEAVDESVSSNGIENYLMLCSNIKDFKLINELFGEKTGDEVLKRQAQIFRKYSHDDSIYGRIGDDKFAIYMRKDYYSEENFKEYIDSLKTLTDSSIYRMNVYVGIYEPIGRMESAQEMCDKCFMAIQNVTGDYSQIFSYYDSTLMEKLLEEKNIIESLPQAIKANEIEICLQPIIDTKNISFGAEALCRWNHPLRGMLYPESFLPILEKSGLISQLDEYIWTMAAKKLHEWDEKGFSDSYISVNISEKDFFYTDIYGFMTNLVETYKINPSKLHLEITETALMSDFNTIFELSEKLQKAGFKVSIDNFGNGYSSLNMLKDFKADTLKIDMIFLNDLHNNYSSNFNRNQIILETIINMAKSLNMSIVGEGVENKAQYDVLRQFNCDKFQGYYLSEPLSIAEYENRFIKYNVAE